MPEPTLPQQEDTTYVRVLTATFVEPFRRFFRLQSAGGIVLIVATVIALVAANSPLAELYHHFFEIPVGIGIGDFTLSKSLHFWINDGLMAIFFFLVGLEIKREILIGELASLKRAALPLAGAVGGMLVPALVFWAFNAGHEGIRGWAIPTATDIAFALGIISLLGSRVPVALTIFLTALAIVDDMGAVLIIALFYTEQIVLLPLLIGIGGYIVAIGLNARKVRQPAWYVLAGLVVWFGFFYAGIHPTIAGVLMGLVIPVRGNYDNETWLASVEGTLQTYRAILVDRNLDDAEEISKRQEAVGSIEAITEKARSPLARLEHGLQPWVAFGIMPVFALANAGVTIPAGAFDVALASSVSIGVFLGLFVGKQIGVLLISWIAVKLGIADLPGGVTWRHIHGAGVLAGIGFTMSLFITELSYPAGSESIDLAKIAILGASVVAGSLGYLLLRLAPTRNEGLA